MKKNTPVFSYQDGEAICVITDGTKVFYGAASCHPEDEDMMSEKTGCEIALRRAKIKALRSYRDELSIKLKALKGVYHSMNRSHRFNPKSYENVMLQRYTRMIESDLATVREMIVDEEQSLRAYINEKDVFYKQIRKQRERKEKANIEQS